MGTTSPSYRLDVQSSSTTNVARLQNGTGASLYFYCNGSAASSSGVFGESGGQNGLSIVSQSNYITLNTNNAERVRIPAAGGMVVGTAALATNATDGFLYIPGCAGTPTGTPTAYTGRVPLVVDTTNNKLYFYSGGAWRDAGP